MSSIAVDVTAARRRLGWRQDDLAEKAGTTQGTISRLERGLPSRDATIHAVARALGEKVVTVDGELRFASALTRSADNETSVSSVTEQSRRVAEAVARIVLDLPEDALAGLAPARVEQVILRAKLAALEAAEAQQAAQARSGGSS